MGQELRIDTVGRPRVVCNLCGGDAHEHVFTKSGYELVRCEGCDLVFVGNPPELTEVEDFYAASDDYHVELLDPRSIGFDRMRKIARQHLRMLRRSERNPRGLRLLDVGCSSGIFINEASKADYEVYGAELSPRTATFARDHFGLEVHCGDWRDAGHAEGSLDVITLFDVVEHLPDPLEELTALRALLKPGGLLLQSTPNIDGLFPRASYKLASKLDYWPHPEPPHHLFQFSVDTLSALTRKAGYQIDRVDQTRIQLGYSFGTPESWRVSPKLLAYATLFAPFAIVGPLVGKGDWLYLSARNPG